MDNEVISGVCKRLSEHFGEEIKIYTEQVEQGVKEPCFFVCVVSEKITPIVGKRYNWRNSVNVVYSPKHSDEKRENIYDVMFDLLDVLEYIDTDSGKIRGTELSGDVSFDEAGIYLSVNATYEYIVYKKKTADVAVMEELSVTEYGKEK